MQDLKAYRKCREDLLWDALSLAGLIATQLPVRAAPGSVLSRSFGSQWRSDELRLVASKLEDLTYRFDALQHALGLWEHPARFGHEPPGSTNTPSQEDPPMAKKSTPKTSRPKSTPKKPAGDPAKQPPRNPRGGSGYNDNYHA